MPKTATKPATDPCLTTATTLDEAVFQALGAASTAWENPGGAGIFDSSRAKAIGEELLAGIQSGRWELADVSELVDPATVAQAAFVAGLVHATLAQGGWTILESDPASGRVRVGCAALFGPGTVADVVVTVRKVDEL